MFAAVASSVAKSKSGVWHYTTKIDHSKVECKFATTVADSESGSTIKIRNHLKRKYDNDLAEEEKQMQHMRTKSSQNKHGVTLVFQFSP